MTTLELLDYIASERKALAACYPLPSPLDCVRYALTELGEYEDAMLRAERTGDKRNNQKPSDARRELGQVGEMLGAALVQLAWRTELDEHDIEAVMGTHRLATVAYLCEEIAGGISTLIADKPNVRYVAWSFTVWVSLVMWHGWDAHALLVERYAQVREKHCTEVQP